MFRQLLTLRLAKHNPKPKAVPSQKTECSAYKDVHIMLALGLSGRTTIDGDVMSASVVAFTPHDKTMHALFHRNVLPQHPRPYSNSDVMGFLRKSPDTVDLLMQDRVPMAQCMREFLAWLKPFGKVTLVGSPLMSRYSFLAMAMQTHAPTVTAPWGFSGVCAKSFASGVLGVPVKDLGKNDTYVKWHEGLTMTGFSGHDAIAATVAYINSATHASGNSAPVVWGFPKPAWFGVPSSLAPQLQQPASFEFAEYPKMVDSDIRGADVIPAECRGGEWVATEKVHGANLSVWTDGTAIRVAKRTGFLTAEDGRGFFGFDRVVSSHVVDFLAIHGETRRRAPSLCGVASEDAVAAVVVFGEIAGGEYVHGDVAKDLRGRRVQAGVQYAPTNIFYGFDIAVVLREDPTRLRMLSFDAAGAIFDAAAPQLLRAVALHRGSFDEVMAAEVAFQSTIPGRLGLPALATPNFAEGLVLRPATAELTTSGGARVILKRKHAMFKEFASAGAADLPAAELVFSMITRQRVAAVASKYTAAELSAAPGGLGAKVLEDALSDAATIMADRNESFDRAAFAGQHRLALAQALSVVLGNDP